MRAPSSRLLPALFVLLFWIAPPGVAADSPAFVDVLHSEVSLRLASADSIGDTPRLALAGVAYVTCRLVEADRIELDAYDLTIDSLEGDGIRHWSYDGERLAVFFGAPVTGERTLRIAYSATPGRGVTLTESAVWTAFHTWHWMPTTLSPAERATL